MADCAEEANVDETEKPSTSSGRKSGRGQQQPKSSTSAAVPVKMDFVPGALIEARDFADNWFPSKIVEVDAEGREVLVHFQNWSSRYDEWISMDSARLRPATNQSEKAQPMKGSKSKDFKVGEKVMAVWHNNKRYPAQITKVLEPGNFEVIFYDGFVMPVKAKQMSRIPKEQADKMEIPFPTSGEGEKVVNMAEIGSKEERRKRKKKIEVAELFRYYKKRPSTENPKDGISPTPSGSTVKEEDDEEAPPTGSLDSGAEDQPPASPSPQPHPTAGSEGSASEGAVAAPDAAGIPKKKKKKKKKAANLSKSDQKTLLKDHGDVIKLKDEKLPAGWEKRARLKTVGTKAGKWDVIIIGPEGRTFRSKQDIKHYLFVRQLDHDLELFDFRLGTDFYTSRGVPVPKRALNPLSRSSFSPATGKKEEATPPSRSRKRSEAKKEDLAEGVATADAAPPAEPALPAAGSEPSAASPSLLRPTPGSAKRTESPLAAPSTSGSEPATTPVVPPTLPADNQQQTIVPEEASGGFRCPLEDCRKLFRRDNLLVMHIKHYHPALLKKLGCKTVRVEDLAAARTAFDPDEMVKSVPAPSQPHPTPPPAPPPAQQQQSPATQTHSILASILTVPPGSASSLSPHLATPSPPPTTRLRPERKSFTDLSSSFASNEDVPLSKRISLAGDEGKRTSGGLPGKSRRRSDRRPPPIDPAIAAALAEEAALREQQQQQQQQQLQLPPESDEAPELADAEGMRTDDGIVVSTLDDIPGQKELVHCFCGSPDEDGLMIQCELCLCWQHGYCLAIDREENVPDPYVCHFCRYPLRERLSRRYTHDQSWLKKGQLPSLKFISGASSVQADRSLRVAHTLTAAATDLKQLLHSLKVKIDIAKNKDHPKLYLWAQPWSKKTENEASASPDPVPGSTGAAAPVAPNTPPPAEDIKAFVPNIPLPEAPIDATDCRLNLLMHIADYQEEVDARLETLEGLFEECEKEENPMESPQVAKMLQILLKDVLALKRMASFSWSS